MNQLMVGSPQQMMTSLEIADLVESRHDNVKVTIDRLVARKLINRPAMQDGPKAANGIVQQVYMIGKRDSYVIVAQLSPEFTARLVDRWQELEASGGNKSISELTRLEIAQMLVASETERLAMAQKIEDDAPKVRFAETIRSIDGVCHIEKIAKTLGFGRNKFFKRLRDDGILMKNNLPYQKYIDRGYFTVIEGSPFNDSDGVKHPVFTTQVTGAGQVFLAKRYSNIEGVV